MEKKKLTIKEIGIEKIIIIFLTGIFLLFLSVPSFQKTDSTEEVKTVLTETEKNSGRGGGTPTGSNVEYINWQEKRLRDILGKVEGIGQLEVMITVKGSSEKLTLKDAPYTQENTTEDDGGGGSRKTTNLTREDETVLVSGESGESLPYVVKEIEPEIEGVVVLAEGARSSKLIQEIVDAVQVLFDVPAHKIKVMKMEGVHH